MCFVYFIKRCSGEDGRRGKKRGEERGGEERRGTRGVLFYVFCILDIFHKRNEKKEKRREKKRRGEKRRGEERRGEKREEMNK